MTAKQIFEKGQVLTVAKAQELKGKKIATTSAEYHMNTPHVSTFIVGEIISEWDDAARREYPKQNKGRQFDNFQQYWASYMNDQQIDEMKTRLLLFSADGHRFHVAHTKYDNYYDEPTFTGSDADREVYYVEVPMKAKLNKPLAEGVSLDGFENEGVYEVVRFSRIHTQRHDGKPINIWVLKSATGHESEWSENVLTLLHGKN